MTIVPLPTPNGNLYIMTEPEMKRREAEEKTLHRRLTEVSALADERLKQLDRAINDLRKAEQKTTAHDTYAEACAPFNNAMIRTAKEELFAQLYGGLSPVKADSEETALWRHAFLEACSDMKDTPGGEPEVAGAAAAADEALQAFRNRFRQRPHTWSHVFASDAALKSRVALAVQASLRAYALRTWPDPDCCERRAAERLLQDVVMAEAASAAVTTMKWVECGGKAE